MPTLSRWFVRTALVALLAGLGLGVATAAEPVQSPSAARAATLTTSAILQLVAAIAFVVNTWPRLKSRS
jgi:hypothetical protein